MKRFGLTLTKQVGANNNLLHAVKSFPIKDFVHAKSCTGTLRSIMLLLHILLNHAY